MNKIPFSSVIKKLECVGNLIKNIEEDIIFYTNAELVKHKYKKEGYKKLI